MKCCGNTLRKDYCTASSSEVLGVKQVSLVVHSVFAMMITPNPADQFDGRASIAQNPGLLAELRPRCSIASGFLRGACQKRVAQDNKARFRKYCNGADS